MKSEWHKKVIFTGDKNSALLAQYCIKSSHEFDLHDVNIIDRCSQWSKILFTLAWHFPASLLKHSFTFVSHFIAEEGYSNRNVLTKKFLARVSKLLILIIIMPDCNYVFFECEPIVISFILVFDLLYFLRLKVGLPKVFSVFFSSLSLGLFSLLLRWIKACTLGSVHFKGGGGVV